MATPAANTTPLSPDATPVLQAMDAARERTLALVATLDDEQLERVHSPIMSPLVWDLGHIAAYEDLCLGHRYGKLELLRPELAFSPSLVDASHTQELFGLGRIMAQAYLSRHVNQWDEYAFPRQPRNHCRLPHERESNGDCSSLRNRQSARHLAKE